MSAVLKDPRASLRPMREHDLAKVFAIERRSYDFPWSVGVFTDCLRVGYCCWTILADTDLAGYPGVPHSQYLRRPELPQAGLRDGPVRATA